MAQALTCLTARLKRRRVRCGLSQRKQTVEDHEAT
jgi:hypothetical protein